jgi:prevent-host-death family protein
MNVKEIIIGLKELRENTETYIKHVAKGDSLIVMRRSEPIFKIVPPYADDNEEEWDTLIDFTKLRKGGIPIDELIALLKS